MKEKEIRDEVHFLIGNYDKIIIVCQEPNNHIILWFGANLQGTLR